jgi:soluble calcium-activated nucleotidase 1
VALLLTLVGVATKFAGDSAPCTGCTDCTVSTHQLTNHPDTVDSIFHIKIISDMDRASKVDENTWRALLKDGILVRHADTGLYSLTWGESKYVASQHSYKGRGMELSELIRFDGRLLSFDDCTGIVYEIIDDEALPWQILTDGNGRHNKGFKSEWATVKGNVLFVGSMGKEWTDPKTAEVISSNPQWIKTIAPNGHVVSIDWSTQYNRLREVSGFSSPGYMIHESACWHESSKRWVFLPRRASTEPYDEVLDEQRAANIMILADENFEKVEVVKGMGPGSNIRGFSSFRFIPDFPNEFVAIKTEEVNSVVKTYATVLNMKGEVLMAEQFIDDIKFEGLEIM